jgi:CDGSH-type Zn-finger protein/truncated hemoglobin YjbI
MRGSRSDSGNVQVPSPSSEVLVLFQRARELGRQLGLGPTAMNQSEADRMRFAQAAQRMTDSVIRPLNDFLSGSVSDESFRRNDDEDAQASGIDFTDSLSHLAKQATTLSCEADAPWPLAEAAAGLQDVACHFVKAGTPDRVASLVCELRAIQSTLPCSIRVLENGPYLLTNVERLYNWLGESIETRPRMALCRCGGSGIKPLCDGSHARLNFSGAKDPNRVADHQEVYVGQQVTVFDNRGMCAHSGFCTDRLASAFHVGKEPFVTPSGARADDIIRAVRACPSGALGYAIDGREARNDVNSSRPSSIEVSKDGPYRVTGSIQLIDSEGKPEQGGKGASLEHYSLCRCGHSQNKPFCSGRHWHIQFRDPVTPINHAPTLFEWAGGLPALTTMTRIFYSKYVPEDPLVGPLFAEMAPDHAERVASWLGEVFGGPKNYSERYGGYPRMLSQHLNKGLTEAQRARWVTLLVQAANDAGLPTDAEFRAAFVAYLEWGSRLALENSQPGAKPPRQMPLPRWWWVCDATPGARVSALAPPSEEDRLVQLPATEEAVSFDKHIKPMFRRTDRQSMAFAFDLWSHSDVSTHAGRILDRLEAGTMPCDGAWPGEWIATFRRWIDAGLQE